MSVIGEVVGIVACVAGVISAYRDGGAIIQKIKVKRAANRAPPPPRLLEESIDQAPDEIEKEKRRGIQRFGKAFEEGDHIAVIALQQITIQLQGSLLVKLRVATLDDDAVTDLSSLVDAADIGRDRTISSLLELRQRLLQASPIDELQPKAPSSQTRHASDSKTSQMQTSELPSRQGLNIRSSQEPARTQAPSPVPSPASPKLHRTWTREYGNSHEASGEEDATSGADTPQHHSHRKRHSSLLGFFKHHRSHSATGDQIPKAVQEDVHIIPPTSVPFKPPPQCDVRDQQQAGAQQQDPKFTYQDWEDDPAQIWGARPERRDTVASLTVPPEGPSSPTGTMRSHSSAALSMRPASLTHTNTHSGSSAVPNPTPDNDYLGFCKSAWKLQNGERKAMQKCKEFNDGWSQSNVYFLACASSKCAFAGHIALEKIWDKVWTVEAKGIKFRWSFLAKSHVPQNKVKDHQYAYQCMFCVFLGEKSPVYFGTDTYLEHVQQHRSQPLGEVVLYKTKCIADREAEDESEFDINLIPLNEREASGRKKSTVLSDELMRPPLAESGGPKVGSDAQDSTFSNEPWNEGLSDFHWGGELERPELE